LPDRSFFNKETRNKGSHELFLFSFIPGFLINLTGVQRLLTGLLIPSEIPPIRIRYDDEY
jgi:hypothetical protein